MIPGLLGRIKRLAPAGTGPRAGAGCAVQPATLPGPTAALSWASVLGRAQPGLPATRPPSLRDLKMSYSCCPAPKLSAPRYPLSLAPWLGPGPRAARTPGPRSGLLFTKRGVWASPAATAALSPALCFRFCCGYPTAVLLSHMNLEISYVLDGFNLLYYEITRDFFFFFF